MGPAHVFKHPLLLGCEQVSDLLVGRLYDGAHFLVLLDIRQRSIVAEGVQLIGLRLEQGKNFRLLVVGQAEPIRQHLQHPLRIHHVRRRLFAGAWWQGRRRLNRRARLKGNRLVVRAKQAGHRQAQQHGRQGKFKGGFHGRMRGYR